MPIRLPIFAAFRLASLSLLVMVFPAVAGAETPGLSCRLPDLASGFAQAVIDGRTFTLDSGPVRLGGIEIPSNDGAEQPRSVQQASRATRLALEELIGGQKLVLRKLGPAQDRYGRTVAQVFVAGAGSEQPERWVQAELVSRGFARVSARMDDRQCAAALLARERAARDAKLGLWADPYYVMRRAEEPAGIGSERGRFTIVEGKVLSVRESGGTIYVNFGRRWSEDFTVTIAKRNERSFRGAGMEPKKLEGRRVRVRGWVEERGGPWIDAARPEQIEIVEP